MFISIGQNGEGAFILCSKSVALSFLVFFVRGGGLRDVCTVWRRDLKLYLYAFHLLKGDVILKIYFVSLLSHFDIGYCKVPLLLHLPCTILLRTIVESVIWPPAI